MNNVLFCDISECSGCKFAKMTSLPFKTSTSFPSAPLQLVHTDLWGPSSITTKDGSLYYVCPVLMILVDSLGFI